MKRIICLTALITFFGLCFGSGGYDTLDCKKDIKDQRGKMKPWKKGAWKTGRYRNVFMEAGYTRADLMHLSGNYRIITPG